MLETIREYALEMLDANGEERLCRHAHAVYYMTLAEESERELVGPQQASWLEWLELEHDNLRAALDWSLQQDEDTNETQRRVEIALRLAGALRRFWQMHGHLNEGQTFTEKALSASEGIPVSTQARAKALIAAGTLASIQNDYDRTEVYCRESLLLFRELGDQQGTALSLFLLSVVPMMKGDNVTARSLAEEALALFREMGEKERVAWSLSTLGLLDTQEEKYASAHARYEESLAIHRKLSNKRGIAASLLRLAQLLFVSQGDQAALNSLLDECLTLNNELGEREGIANVHSLSAQLAFGQGDISSARAQIEKSILLYREIGQRRALAESLAILARIVLSQGERTEARALYDESQEIARELNHMWLIASCLEGRAGIAAEEGQFTWAVQLWGAADALRETIRVPIPLIERAEYERSIASARSRLSEKDFAAAWEAGRVMRPEQAITSQGNAIIAPLAAPTTSSSSTYPAGLTAREVEVLRLVARGLTSGEIALELKISEKTVAHHLTHIFNKTSSDNRAAAAAFAIRQGLA
jgi:DNA-binding CsgD family transcriptional regulator/tetratricopeptide (TPR) repeat protein